MLTILILGICIFAFVTSLHPTSRSYYRRSYNRARTYTRSRATRSRSRRRRYY